SEDWLQFLRNVDPKELVAKTKPSTRPVFGTEFLPLSAQKAFETNQFNSDIDLIAGINSNEGSILSAKHLPPFDETMTIDHFKHGVQVADKMFHGLDVQKVVDYYLKGIDTNNSSAVRRAFYEFYGDIQMKYPTYLFAKLFAINTQKSGKNVYFYELTYQSQAFADIFKCGDEMSSVAHGMDIPIIFGWGLTPDRAHLFSDTDAQFSRDVMRMWTNFAKYGKPDDKWPQLLGDNNVPKVKNLNPAPTLPPMDDPYRRKCALVTGSFNKYVRTGWGGGGVYRQTLGRNGKVRGQTIQVLNTTINEFLGIPYAEPPVGKLRFAKPEPIKTPIKDIIDATKPKDSCIQNNLDIFPNLTFSENCLFVNIWTQNVETNDPSKLKPVMFYIHGGGLAVGSIFGLNGSVLATNEHHKRSWSISNPVNPKDIPLALLRGPLQPKVLVRDNIHVFGGDRDQITIFGGSAGSWSVSAHILSPLSRGLFKRAIMESGMSLVAIGIRSLYLVEVLDWLQCLRSIDAKEFNKYSKLMTYPVLGTDFLPISAQKAFADKNFNSDVDIIAGIATNEDITSPLALREAFYELVGDLIMKCPTYHFAKQFATSVQNKKNVYFYQVTYMSQAYAKLTHCDIPGMGICHCAEGDFVFGNPFITPDIYSDLDRQFSLVLMKMWTNFVKYGQPDIDWPHLLNINTIDVKNLNPNPKPNVFVNPYAATCDVFVVTNCIETNVDVKTTSGVVRGQTIQVLNQTINEFLGIPYAEPPIGKLRFAKPEPIKTPIKDIISATKPKDSCIQPLSPFPLPNLTYSENCLFVNIWTQNVDTNGPSKLKPVMFFIHGGGLSIGSVFTESGSVLATNDVVIASTSYRLGQLGFLYG
ncbi:unnamed protein product, partial [Oppiella nova]